MCHFAFKMYRSQAHSQVFLVDTLTLMHNFLAMVDDHSRGKVITIRRRKAGAGHATGGAKKKKRTDQDSDDELAAANGAEEDPASGDELDPEGGEYGEEEEDEDEIGYENKQFNFNQELSILVDYHIIGLMIQLLDHEKYNKNGDVL